MLQMMRGGGPQHSLTLQLGSSQTSQGAPHAEHLPPQGLGAGFNLPLLTPQPVQAAPPPREAEDRPRVPQEFQRPKGKMLIFWGCGEHAKPGQPLVIDFAQMTPEKMAAGQMPPGLLAAFRGLDVRRMQPPSPGRNTTYGDWPNSQSRTTVPSEGSLVGQHTVTGSYSPEIQFALSKDQDFLGPLELTTNAKLPSGAVQLGWGALPGAEAYVASFIGGGGPPRRRGRGGPNGPGDASGPPPPSPQDAAAARRKAILQGLGGLIPH